ncbi:Cobalamin adenosyltransferase-like domain-containing protein [Plasmodiophora brassicae]
MSESDEELRRVRIYTRSGDQGTSSLYNGKRRPKSDPVFHVLGDIDELNAHIGLAREYCTTQDHASLQAINKQMSMIQSRLLDIGTHVATPRSSSNEKALERAAFPGGQTEILESWIDELDKSLPPLRNFILPSGGLPSAAIHVARTVSRRVERDLEPVIQDGDCDRSVGMFVNRLSDYLFVAARTAAHALGVPETTYKKQ